MTDEAATDEAATDEAATDETVPQRRLQSNDPMHGVTLKMILDELVDHYGWDELGDRIRINCFVSDPSVASSLKFLRKTPWARKKVESLFLAYSAERSAILSEKDVETRLL